MKQTLGLVAEFVRLFLADVLEARAIMGKRPARRELCDDFVVQPIEVEMKEQKMRRGGGDLLLRVAEELGARRMGGVAVIDEPGVGGDSPEQAFDRLVARNGLRERSGIGVRQVGFSEF